MKKKVRRSLRRQVLGEIGVLEACYFLAQSVHEKNRTFLSRLRTAVDKSDEAKLAELLEGVREEVGILKRETGCQLDNTRIVRLVEEMTARREGWVYIPKIFLDRWFEKYTRVFPRWSHVPLHTLVVFDSDPAVDSPYALFLAEAALFDDVVMFLREINTIVNDGKTFRTRGKEMHRRLYAYLRATATTVYHFLESYLNGLAWDTFQTHHAKLSIDEHDLLAEWDSIKRRTRYIAFEQKIKRYPEICGKYLGKEVSLRTDKDVDFLVGEGKRLRDSMTHPSPYVNYEKADWGKFQRFIEIRPDQVGLLFQAATRYVERVERGLGRDPRRSCPWLLQQATGA